MPVLLVEHEGKEKLNGRKRKRHVRENRSSFYPFIHYHLAAFSRFITLVSDNEKVLRCITLIGFFVEHIKCYTFFVILKNIFVFIAKW